MFRYPGIQPFTQDQQKIFMGRNVEKRELLNLLKIYPLTVLFAKSGIGKSSLIQAGVQPELADNKIIPVFIRLNLEELSPEEQFYNHLVEQGFLDKSTPNNLTLWEHVKKARFVKHGKYFTPLLIFDQFEELFTSYTSERRLRFVKEFAEIANGTIPVQWRDSLQSKKESIHPVQYEKLLQPLNVKILLALRSDMLHYLEGLTDFIPGIFRCLYELQALNEKNAKEAICLPAAVVDEIYTTAPFSYGDDALKEITNFLQKKTVDSNGHKTNVESIIECSNLQVVCQYIEKLVTNERANGNNVQVVEPSLYQGIEGLEKIIDDFYQRTIDQFTSERQEIVRNTVERGLMKNGRRLSMEKAYLIDQFGITADELNELVNDRLLRKEPRMGSDYYEISHDTLIAPINRSYLIRKEREDRIKEAQEEREKVEEQAEKNKRRFRRIVSVLGTLGMIMALLAIAFAYYANEQRKEIHDQNEILNEKSDSLRKQTTDLTNANKAIRDFADSTLALKNLSDSLSSAIIIERNIAKANAYLANNGIEIARAVLIKTQKYIESQKNLHVKIDTSKETKIKDLLKLCSKKR